MPPPMISRSQCSVSTSVDFPPPRPDDSNRVGRPRLPQNTGVQRNVLIPLIVACALFMENMDSTVIATALPAIAADIGESPLALKLALTSYLVGLAVFIPISGWVADRVGSRTVFASAIVVFVAGSLLCAMSSTLAAFVAARFLQGIGGAMMVPVGRLVLLRTVPKEELLGALNTLTIPALLGPVTGPALGGAITLYFHWRWIFLINLPIGALGLYLVLRYIPNVKEPDVPPLDLAGFALAGIGLSVLMLGLSSLGGHLMPGIFTAACIVVGGAALLAYPWHARRTAHPLIDLSLFRLPTIHTGVLVGSLFRIGVGATPFLLPLLLQLGFGLNPLQSGLLTCATAVGAMFMKTLTTIILRRFGFRRVLTANALVASAAVAVCALFTSLQAVSFAEVKRETMSQASSIASMAQRLSQSLGVAIGAYALQISGLLQGHADLVVADFPPAFVAIGLISAVPLFFHAALPKDAGAEISGHGRPGAPPLRRAGKSQ